MASNEGLERLREGEEHRHAVDGVPLAEPQWTRNDLERDLLAQLAFSPRVWGIVTRPVIATVEGEPYAPSCMFSLYQDKEGRPLNHVVEAVARADLARPDARREAGFAAAAAWCAGRGAAFHVVDESVLRTAHLDNARLLGEHKGHPPHEDDVRAMEEARKAAPDGRITAAAAAAAVRATGIGATLAEDAARQAAAEWIFKCDLSVPWAEAVFEPMDAKWFGDTDQDPFLRLVRGAGAPPTRARR